MEMSVFNHGTFNWDIKRLKIPEKAVNLRANTELCSCSGLWYWVYRRDVTKACTENTFSLRSCIVLWGWCGCVVLWSEQESTSTAGTLTLLQLCH